MSKKAMLVLTVLVVLLFGKSQGNPALGIENKEVNPTVSMGSRITPRIGEWINFHRTWSFPSLTSVSSLFTDEPDEDDASLVKKRLDSLESTQREIIGIIKKIAQDISAISPSSNNKNPTDPVQPGEPVLPIESVDKKNETSAKNQTIPSIIGETSLNENQDQKPTDDEKPEVTKKPVEFEKPLPQKNPNLNLTTGSNINGENFTEPVVDQEIPEKIETSLFESKPEVATSEEENKSGNIVLASFARSQGLRANGRMPWNKDNN